MVMGGALVLHTAVSAEAQDAVPTAASTGVIQGRMYVADEERTPERALILVIPSDLAQPVHLEDFFEGDINQVPATRVGPGAVRPDARGEYSVTDLAPGEYLVFSSAPFVEYEVRPPDEVQVSALGEISTMRAFRVTVLADQVTAVDIVFAGPPAPEGPSRLKICMVTFDPDALVEEQAPDRITTVDVQPASSAITITIAEDGCAILDNIPAGTYTITVRTERGFERTEVIEIGAGEDGQITLGEAAPRVAHLPTSGGGHSGGSDVVAGTLGPAGLAVFVAGALIFGALRRRGA